MPFDKNVFINCPFDTEFGILLKPLVFALLYLGFEPRLSQTKSSSHIRVDQILQHINESKFGIHDLSRSKAMQPGDLPRFNMPYELGLDIGCAKFGNRRHRGKKILILETEKYHYQKVLSDIAGQDIENHNNDPRLIVKKVRDWFATLNATEDYPGSNDIWSNYNQFRIDLSISLKSKKYSEQEIEEMMIGEFIKHAKGWIKL